MIALRTTALALALLLTPVAAVQAEQTFSDPEKATAALVDAVRRDDQAALKQLLGEDWRFYLPASDTDRQSVERFLSNWQQAHRIEQSGNTAHLSVGQPEWVLPLPLTHTAKGWQFDMPAAASEIRIRTIGGNELSAIQASLAYVAAQREYQAVAHDGARQYAQKIISSPGKRDGLYWPVADGAPPSPLGPAFGDETPGRDYHGYYYRILTSQGAQAAGGAHSYLDRGRMSKGFALLAWPASYGNSGVTSFIVNQNGVVYQRDLGNDTEQTAGRMTAFNPDQGWQRVAPELQTSQP